MSFGLPTASLRIADLLADPFLFAIPLYQRPYSWTVKEAGQLLDDVLAASGVEVPDGAEADYFLGAILLLSTTDEENLPSGGAPRVYEIIDGQQRLVTLTILVCALRDLDEADGADILAEVEPLVRTAAESVSGSRGSYRLELRGRQQEFMQSCVLVEGGSSEMPSLEGLGEAERRILDIREHFISELSGYTRTQRLELARYIKQACYFVVMLTRDIDRAHRMFVVLNGRGKPLSRHDILKAEILNKVSADMAGRAVATWDSVAGGLDEEEFETFFSHVRSIHGHYRPQVIAGIRAVIADVGGAEAFVSKVFEPLARAYQGLLRPGPAVAEGPLAEVRRSLIYLHRLSGAEWMPAAMVASQLYASDPALLAVQMREIERFTYLLRLLCLGSGRRVRRFADIVDALRSGRSLADQDSPCQLSRDDRRTINYNLRDLHGRNQQICKLVLLRINDELAGRLTELHPASLSVEHVLPQRTGPASPWRSWFPDAQERETCVQSLGNLLLLTPKLNDRAKNQEFLRKRDVYAEARDSGIEPLLADVVAASTWTSREISAREARLLELLDRIWRIQLSKEMPVAPASAPVDGGGQRKRRGKKNAG